MRLRFMQPSPILQCMGELGLNEWLIIFFHSLENERIFYIAL